MRIRALPEGQKRPLTPIWHIAAAFAGAAVFLVVNLLLLIDRCPPSSSGFGWNCSQGALHHFEVLLIAGALTVVALLGRRARTFSLGFFGGLLTMAATTMGSCTPSWGDPVKAVTITVERRRAERARERELVAARERWIAAMNQQTLDVPRGVYMVGDVLTCAQGFANTHGGTPAAREGQLSHCINLREYSASYDLDPPRRYEIPTNGDRRAMQSPDERLQGDPAWRIHYEVLPTGVIVVHGAPDSRLAHTGPLMRADSSGTFELQAAPNAPRFSISPVFDLREMVACLKGVPEEVERRTQERGGVSYGWFLTSMTKRLCRQFEAKLRAMSPNDENATLLVVSLPVGPDGKVIPVVAYKVAFLIRQPANAPYAFDLSAIATTPGLPRYFATFEGTIHTTMEWRVPTADDPVVPTGAAR